ncbi:IS982 family transposase, partial [Chryseobacterium sp. RLHN22]
MVDEFFKEFDNVLKDYALKDPKIKIRYRKSAMSQSEVMTIM